MIIYYVINNYYCGVLNLRLILYWDKYPKCSIILADGKAPCWFVHTQLLADCKPLLMRKAASPFFSDFQKKNNNLGKANQWNASLEKDLGVSKSTFGFCFLLENLRSRFQIPFLDLSIKYIYILRKCSNDLVLS